MGQFLQEINGPWPAFLAGLVTSLHCAAMCGPLGCVVIPAGDRVLSPATALGIYHGMRVLSYTLIGALAGGLGLAAITWNETLSRYAGWLLPWAFVAYLLVVAFRIDRWIPQLPVLTRSLARLTMAGRRAPAVAQPFLVGTLTPLLPCGPLYWVFGLALMTQSPVTGAEFLLAFGLGTLPLLWFAQSRFARLKDQNRPERFQIWQRRVAFLAAVVVTARIVADPTGSGGWLCGTP